MQPTPHCQFPLLMPRQDPTSRILLQPLSSSNKSKIFLADLITFSMPVSLNAELGTFFGIVFLLSHWGIIVYFKNT